MRVDAHHHLWDLAVTPQPWIDAEMIAIDRSFTASDYAAAAAPFIDQSVVVQTIADPAETPLLLAEAASTALIGAVVGWVDLLDPEVGAQLDQLLGGPHGQYLRGIRHPLQSEPDDRWLCQPQVMGGLVELARRDLVYELLTVPSQLAAVAEVAHRLPQVRFVLDHLSKPNIASGSVEPWASDLARLASAPNVAAKLSGLVTEAAWRSWTVDDLSPYVELALMQFGPDRLMFGSDWPVCQLAASYAQVIESAEALTAGLTVSERAAVLGDTATQIYRLEAR